MTEIDAATFVPPRDDPPAAQPPPDERPTTPAAVEPTPPSFTRRIAGLTVSRTGARAGIAWIGVMVFFAVFAPVLANSHPLLLKTDDHWSAPFLRFLTPADVTLQVSFWTGLAMVLIPLGTRFRRFMIWLALVVVSTVVTAFTVKPPEPIVYDTYRVAQRQGEVQAVWYTPIHFSPEDRLRDQPAMQQKPVDPGGVHPMGTTAHAADLASNMIYASRVALSIGFVATSVAVILGVIMGGLMGYLGGWVDLIGMRIVEIFESIPTLLLLLAFAGLFQNVAASAVLYYMMAIIGFLSSFSYAEFVRAEFLSLRKQDFVHAAQAAGVPTWSILFRHLLPNGITPVIVNASFGVAGAILAESTLSFLNIGLREEASWGNLLNQALGAGGSFYWWLALFPGLAIFLTVFSYNLIGEALRDAMDPRINRMA